MADLYDKKKLLFGGMFLQAIALVALVWANSMTSFVIIGAILGFGTAMVYPTFLVTIAENTHPLDRAKSIGIFRLWRDLGYAMGAILTGIIADLLNLNSAILFIAFLTMLSSFIVIFRMKTVLYSNNG
jgi:MFS family permease